MAVDQPKPADAARAADEGPSGAAPAKSGNTAEPAKPAEPDLADMKRKFRAALDRKRGSQASANAEGAQETSKVHDAHGPAASRRSFRRKSGS